MLMLLLSIRRHNNLLKNNLWIRMAWPDIDAIPYRGNTSCVGVRSEVHILGDEKERDFFPTLVGNF